MISSPLPHFPRVLVASVSMVALLSLGAFACSGDDDPADPSSGGSAGAGGSGQSGSSGSGGSSQTSGGSAGAAGADPSPLYALAAEVETPEGDFLYLATTPDLAGPFDPVANGIEIANASTFKFVGEAAFVGLNDAPTITKYVLDDSDQLQEDLTLSFAGVGAASAVDYTIISETKAYLFDTATFTVHVWNPSTMELTGTEIDLSAAINEERGPLGLSSWRYQTILHNGMLFVPGGWWGDAPAQASLVLAFDTTSDEVHVIEDATRCTYLDSAIKTSSGDIFFFAQSFALVNSELPSCALVIRDGELEFDPDYALDVQAALEDRIGFSAFQGPGDFAYVQVYHDDRIEHTTRPEIRSNSRNDVRLWKLDLASEAAEEVTSVDFYNHIRFGFDLGDGRMLANVNRLNTPDDPESDDYACTPDMHELLEGNSPTPVAIGIADGSVGSRIAEIARLR